jgi:hypothetical protein
VSVFAEGANNSLDTYWATPGVTAWSGLLVVGDAGTTYSAPAAVLNPSTGLVSLFAEGANNSLDTYWGTPGVTAWSGLLVVGTSDSSYWVPEAVVNPTGGLILLFALATNGNLDNYWTVAGSAWSGPLLIGSAQGQPPSITSSNQSTLIVGLAGTFPVTTGVSFPTPSMAATGALPSGVTFTDNGDGTATLAGTPAAGTAGTYPITITASNGISPNASQDFTLTVVAMDIITTALPVGAIKTPYSATLTAIGGNPPYMWSLAKGSDPLPPGLKLKAPGVISGKPKKAGTYSFTVRVVDTKTKTKPHTQNSAMQTLSITIS